MELAGVLLCVAVAGFVSIGRGQDANWDLQNYHFYNPWALLNGRLGWDIAAAQLQTYFNPTLDIPFYAMVAAGWPPRLIAFALALPAGVGAWLLAKLLLLLFRDLPRTRRFVCVGAALAIGVTASHAVGMLGVTMNEWPGAALTVAALWLLVRAMANGRLPGRTLLAAGAMSGLATGLKLTAATYAVALAIALILCSPRLRRGFADAFVFGLGVVAGVAAGGGYWMALMWSHFDSPVFPFFNDYIRSPWWVSGAVPGFYGPHTLTEWLVFPLRFFRTTVGFVGEMPFRDWRIPLLYLLTLCLCWRWVWQTLRNRQADGRPAIFPPDLAATWQLVAVFWAVSFPLWVAQHSIYRYIVALELLVGALIIGGMRVFVRGRAFPWAAIAIAIAAIAPTRYPDYWHVEFGPRWFDVHVPVVESRALVLLHSDAPMAYVLPFFPADARFLGIYNNFNNPQSKTRTQDELSRVIATHRGPLYSLASPAGKGIESLTPYGLERRRETCAGIASNMPHAPIELCRLQRVSGPSAVQPEQSVAGSR